MPTEPHSGIVSVDELINHMGGISLNAVQRVDAARKLAGVQQDLENYLNRPLEPVQMREYVQADAAGYANVKVSPIHKVIRTEGMSGITLLTASTWYGSPYIPPVVTRDPLIGANGLLIDHFTPAFGDPVFVPGGIFVGYPNDWYAVEYVGGYNGYVDEGLKLAIKVVAARQVGPIHDDVLSLRGGDADQAPQADNRGMSWTLEEKQAWDRLRRRVVV